MKASNFFSSKQKTLIFNAIQAAEKKTSGEIKIHIENRCNKETLERAKEVFYLLHMDKTIHRNGILIYIAIQDKKVAIIGDEGIDKKTPDNYWETEIQTLLSYFKRNEFTNGIVKVINNIGEKLELYFPFESNDINEIPDNISFYDN